MSARVTAHGSNDRHQDSQRNDLGNRRFELGNHKAGSDSRHEVHRKPRKALFGGVDDTVRERSLTHTCETQNVFFVLFIQNDHRVIDRYDTHEPFVLIHDGRGNQVILVERIGDIAFILHRGNDLKNRFRDFPQKHVALGAHKFAKGDIANRLKARINEGDMVKLFRQRVLFAQVINGLAHSPVLWRHDDFALHQAAR